MQKTARSLAPSFLPAPVRARINPALRPDPAKPFLLRLLDTLAAWNARQRDAHKLRNMPLYRLEDMGISRGDVENAFRR